MLSKLLRPKYSLPVSQFLIRATPSHVPKMRGHYIPASQYDSKPSKKFQLSFVLKNCWETIPLFVTIIIAKCVLLGAILWAISNKTDVVFQTHSRKSISRTMNLRYPTIHKIITINQKYEPWPEMQDVLDEMVLAEKRAEMRAKACQLP